MNAEATAVRDTKPMGAAAPGRWSAPPSDAAVPAAVARPAAGGKATSAAKTAGASRETSLASVALARPAKDPQSAAVAWYANRLRISPDRVQALQQQRVNGST